MEEYKCKMCDQLFKCRNNLVKHQSKKNKCNIITPFQCKKCNKYFKQNRSLINHSEKCIEEHMIEIINFFYYILIKKLFIYINLKYR